MNNREWFQNAKYGMMAHWGLYSILGGEYRGRRVENYAEWIQSYMPIPNAEYEQLAGIFNPICFSADEWIRLAKECGMQYFVFTSKHHDGFAMFHSKADKYNIVDAAPFGRDAVAELGEACYKHGLKFGLYYSQELDWHHPHGGGYDHLELCSGVSWDNSWDYPDRMKIRFGRPRAAILTASQTFLTVMKISHKDPPYTGSPLPKKSEGDCFSHPRTTPLRRMMLAYSAFSPVCTTQ